MNRKENEEGKYIEASVLKQKVLDRSSHLLNEWDTLGVLAVIDETPKADVKQVVHGYWYLTSDYEWFTCSACGDSYYNGSETTKEARQKLETGDYYEFCPHCGAEMGAKV